jgi:mercuric ion binding protein
MFLDNIQGNSTNESQLRKLNVKKLLTTALFATSMFVAPASIAAEQTIKLSVPGMSCASCPYIVKGSITMLDGIKNVEATMVDRTATVIFDDAVTNVVEIRKATEGVGYPSTVIQ